MGRLFMSFHPKEVLRYLSPVQFSIIGMLMKLQMRQNSGLE